MLGRLFRKVRRKHLGNSDQGDDPLDHELDDQIPDMDDALTELNAALKLADHMVHIAEVRERQHERELHAATREAEYRAAIDKRLREQREATIAKRQRRADEDHQKRKVLKHAGQKRKNTDCCFCGC